MRRRVVHLQTVSRTPQGGWGASSTGATSGVWRGLRKSTGRLARTVRWWRSGCGRRHGRRCVVLVMLAIPTTPSGWGSSSGRARSGGGCASWRLGYLRMVLHRAM